MLINNYIDEPNRSRCLELCYDKRHYFERAQGSSHNHQAWPGGYIDHIAETMEICTLLYPIYKSRGVPFALSDAILVMFLHDLEKPWIEDVPHMPVDADFKTKRRMYRETLIDIYGIALSPEQKNALRYVEGEGDDYSRENRTMNELAAFCHVTDISSARIWHNYPKK